MSAERRFVVGIDGSDESRSALRWAVNEAALWDAQLDVVHAWDLPFVVVPPPISVTSQRDVETLHQAAQSLLDTEVSAATDHASTAPQRLEKIVVADSAARALLETAKGADLLVVGTRGRGGFTGLLLGSVSNQCVHHASCPVAIVRGHVHQPLESPRRPHIVVGVDGSDCGHAALSWAITAAARRRAPLVALAAWSSLDQPGEFEPDFGAADIKSMADAAVERARDEVADGTNVEIEIRLVNDRPAHALIEASTDAGTLVVGSRGLGGFRGLLLGSVSNKCAHHAHCPVVVVHS
jgi:nucleotide-binding universal stress UspA family protein